MEPPQQHLELLQSLMSSRPGTRLELTIGSFTHEGVVVFLVMSRSGSDANGIVIGKGFTRRAALADAETCLQGALDAVDVATIKGRP